MRYTLGIILLLASTSQLWAGAWTLPRSKIWTKLSYLQYNTGEWYTSRQGFRVVFDEQQLPKTVELKPGQRVRYDFEGQYASKAVFAEAFYGLTDRLDIGAQIPLLQQNFASETGLDRTDEGLGDIRLFSKLRLLQKPVLFTLKSGIKIPTGKFKNEDGLIPVGSGQWDFDFIAQIGRSFWPLPLYGNLDVGYRVRTINEEIDRDPGDEWFINAELGYNITQKWLLTGKYEALRSGPANEFGGITIRLQINRITYIAPSLLYNLDGRTTLEASLRFTLNGRNYPAGKQLAIGASTHFSTR
ncbi:MAG: transporter [Candidatus Latescibacterota bacterium]|jgi:hypothetical protein|tara:strand:+ start:348 stop:1247 length:900 start_codon:yes stop_codon:yes gene_type:complete